MSVCIQCDASALRDMHDADDDCVSSMMSVYIQYEVSVYPVWCQFTE